MFLRIFPNCGITATVCFDAEVLIGFGRASTSHLSAMQTVNSGLQTCVAFVCGYEFKVQLEGGRETGGGREGTGN